MWLSPGGRVYLTTGISLAAVDAAVAMRVTMNDALDPVTEGSAEGDLVFGMIRRNQHLFYPDLDTAAPPAPSTALTVRLPTAASCGLSAECAR